MNTIPYSYEIVAVDAAARSMLVRYQSPGRPAQVIGARLPMDGEPLLKVIAEFAPVQLWAQLDAGFTLPAVGHSGFVAADSVPVVLPPTLDEAKAAKRAQIASWRYDREVAGISVGGSHIKTDRESQATITGAFTALSGGLVASVDWKTGTGEFVSLGLPEISAIAAAVTQHVQACFSAEAQLVALVDAATTFEQVDAVELPDSLY